MSILAVLAGLLSIPVAVLVFEILGAFKAPQQPAFELATSDRSMRVAVIVPAHNESVGMVATLEDIKSQLEAGDRLIVVADNCTDDTAAVAGASGAEVIARNDSEKVGKGYAMGWGVAHLSADEPDFALFIDADCRIQPGLIKTLMQVCLQVQRPVQALFLMRGVENSSVDHTFSEFAWILKNWVRPLGLRNFCRPVQLMGTGMIFPWDVIKAAPLASGHLVEDLKLGLDLALIGKAPYFYPFVTVSSEFPTRAKGTESQRERWVRGHLGTIVRFVPRLLGFGLMRRNPDLLVLALDLLVPPLSLLALLIVGMAVLTCSATLLGGSWVAMLIALGNLLAFTFGVLLAWVRFARHVLPARRALSLGSFAVQKLRFYGRMLMGKTASKWIRTDRRPM